MSVHRGDFGRLGHGQANDVFIPKPVAALAGETVLQVACGDTHTLVTTAKGVLFSFGRNQNGQLGLGNNDDVMLPRQVEKLRVCPLTFSA
jgi:alpha-tubulin suppressor-like RCC1 family protein